MDDDLYEEAETNLDDAIEAFMNSKPDDDDLSDDEEEHEQTDAEDAEEEDEDESQEDDEESEDGPDEDDEDSDDDEDEADEDDEEEEESDEDEADPVDDEAEVVIKVGDDEKRVPVKELKRLYGQEASLTQKSQALSNQRRVVEAQGMYLANILQTRYQAAQKEAEKYKDVDLFRASRELEPEEFDALRAAKQNAESELQALEREGAEFLQNSMKTRSELLREQAKESLKVIAEKIPDWNDELYGKVRTYAVSQGMDADMVNEVVDPGAILMMHKAMKFDEAQAAAKTKVKKKVTKAPKRVVKKATKAVDNKTSKLKSKQRTAMESGDIDDVAEAFLAAMSEE